MHSLFAGVHIQNKPDEFLLKNIDFDKNVLYLKREIAGKLQYDVNELELVYNGRTLDDDDLALVEVVRPNATVHCFKKTKKYIPFQATSENTNAAAISKVQELFNVIAHIQINVNSRVNILQKILAEYPEFRRNLGAQALIRDSVLFNTFHQPEVIAEIAKHYPIICVSAPFIVDTIKKELTRNTSTSNFSEPATDSTNSSEEENSLGASSSTSTSVVESAGNQSENARIRLVSRQQLQAALAQIGFGSVNSLSNIAHRNSDTTATSAPLSNSASGERISSELFRNELQRALSSLNQSGSSDTTQRMDTSEPSAHDTSDDGSGDIPAYYRTHQYAEQLRTMAQMGFINYEENLTYLNITNGNIENAINLLMGSMN